MKETPTQSLLIVGDDSTLTKQALEVATLLSYEAKIVSASATIPDNPRELVFIALDNRDERINYFNSFIAKQKLTNLLHPAASVSVEAILATNIYVGPNAVVSARANVQSGVVLNALSSIEHDNQIGPHTFIGTGAILCGHVTTGARAFIGGGATILPGTFIGEGVTIGAGAVVTRNAEVPGNYVGNPARLLGGNTVGDD